MRIDRGDVGPEQFADHEEGDGLRLQECGSNVRPDDHALVDRLFIDDDEIGGVGLPAQVDQLLQGVLRSDELDGLMIDVGDRNPAAEWRWVTG